MHIYYDYYDSYIIKRVKRHGSSCGRSAACVLDTVPSCISSRRTEEEEGGQEKLLVVVGGRWYAPYTKKAVELVISIHIMTIS